MATTKDHTEILRELQPGGPYKTLVQIKPSGSLQARRQRDDAVAVVWRYSVTMPDGHEKEAREPIGFWDPKLPVKSLKPTGSRYSFEAAVRAAEALAEQHREHRGEGGLPALRAQEKAAKVQAGQEQAEAAKHSFGRLMLDYADRQEALERVDVKDVRSIIRCHIETWPELANKPANEIMPEDAADLIRRIHEGGKTRAANKTRSYGRAAYEVGKSARTDASVPAKFKGYAIRTNPFAEVRVIRSGQRPVIRALTLDQFRQYWNIIKDIPGMRGGALRLHLLTGGQRLDQFVRLKTADISADAIVLFDGKGKPGEGARPHPVPLTTVAAKALQECVATEGEWALTSDGGKTHIRGETLSGWAIEAVGDQIPGFQPKWVRSGVETLLAANGVDKETRGRLQSHGISGIQDRHYNVHQFLEEKRRALEILFNLIEPPVAKKKSKRTASVTPITAAKRLAA